MLLMINTVVTVDVTKSVTTYVLFSASQEHLIANKLYMKKPGQNW